MVEMASYYKNAPLQIRCGTPCADDHSWSNITRKAMLQYESAEQQIRPSKRATLWAGLCSPPLRCTFLQSRRHSSREMTYKLLHKLGYTGSSAEIGVWMGKNSARLLQRWPAGQKHRLVDPYAHFDAACGKNMAKQGDKQCRYNQSQFDAVYSTVHRDLNDRFPGRVHFIREYSVAAARKVSDASLSFIYIDARHDYEGVHEDLVAWWPKLCYGGLIGGHDWTEAVPWKARGSGRAVRKRAKHPVAEALRAFLVGLINANQLSDIERERFT
mmetsp:Transcript_20906/g.42784  ORF Transcript_20906/g.42784 Transcript_20906/m.42784 type:complete len:271 (-) Transcript_20906:121-933(-)